MDRKAHWEEVYITKPADAVSWYQPTPTTSIELLDDIGVGGGSAVIDIGGGDSTLVDALLARGVSELTVLDISAHALDRARARLGVRASEVTWIEGDVTAVVLPEARYDVWHDRAVFHFLVDDDDRSRYVALAAHAVRPGGHLVIATFAPEGPDRCSGLPVRRYSADALAEAFGAAFVPERALTEAHRTPSGVAQPFTWSILRRAANEMRATLHHQEDRS